MKSFKVLAAAAVLAMVTTASPLMANAANEGATSGNAQKVKFKQCVVFYSPQYKRARIKPINYEFRWCDKSNRSDCSKWAGDVLQDRGRDFSFVGHCFTFHKPLVMEFKFSRTFKKGRNLSQSVLQPQMIKLQGNLAPHPFCATEAVHHFRLRRGKLQLKPGQPRRVKTPDCVWKPTEKVATN